MESVTPDPRGGAGSVAELVAAFFHRVRPAGVIATYVFGSHAEGHAAGAARGGWGAIASWLHRTG